MSSKLKVGIIGVGTVGAWHVEAYQSSGEAEVVAICDIDEPRLQARGQKYGVAERFADYREMLRRADVEAVDVCTPNHLHREMVVAALKAGRKVLVEKPMAFDGAEAAKIVQAEKQTGGIVQVAMVQRQKPEPQLLRELIQQGALGEVYHIRTVLVRHRGIPGMGGWFTTKSRSGGGPLIDIGPHWFDLSLWMTGLWEPTSVSGQVRQRFGRNMRQYKYVGMWAGPPDYSGTCDVEDSASGFVRFGEKATMSFEIAWAANAPSENFIEVLGDKGGMRVMDGQPLKLITEQHGRLAEVHPQIQTKVNPFELQARSFIAACRGKAPPAATAREGMVVNRLIDAIYASSEKGKEVPVKL